MGNTCFTVGSDSKHIIVKGRVMTIPGGWSKYSSHISSEAKAAFDEALKGLAGVSYSPIAVAEQVVAGKNYQFFCNAHVVVPNPTNYAAIVSVHKPLSGDASVTETKTFGDD